MLSEPRDTQHKQREANSVESRLDCAVARLSLSLKQATSLVASNPASLCPGQCCKHQPISPSSRLQADLSSANTFCLQTWEPQGPRFLLLPVMMSSSCSELCPPGDFYRQSTSSTVFVFLPAQVSEEHLNPRLCWRTVSPYNLLSIH